MHINADRELLWSDEFNTNGQYNNSNWKADIGTGSNGWNAQELQYYTSTNAYAYNSHLIIEARKENIQSSRYSSSRLVSIKSFKYGIFEARIKLPKRNNKKY